jgi:farnesyl diphosphate synthase
LAGAAQVVEEVEVLQQRLLGVDGARRRLKTLIVEAEKAIAPFGKDGAILRAAAHFIADRRS